MLDDSGLKMIELAGMGYCCSQIMVLMTLDEIGRENPDLVRSAAGLCNGLGDCSGTCGVYTGAALSLGMYSGKGAEMEEADERLALMLESLRDWFTEATSHFGGTRCGDILDGLCGQPDPARCGGLISSAYAQIRQILVDNGFDPSEGRNEL
ncbi:DVU_1555 family C-GCAxxG-C-C protein [Pseudodesulfovibrio sp. zrk46]|uniref:DVU_1555 family C-GCAxxG-C-C protein n=1 Tax=Pseudodesulfovibrio sp. zrk46 TaxID=2725288 RepID=UPI0014492158|nr:DV_1555 family C-GCAxxG-C-C protein [Pseudodesulfovibrio sp. zrk46]QJB57421.1 C_GCAxxG_C_C family protein [Pseudodesulfovibrio sp. zrk46]